MDDIRLVEFLYGGIFGVSSILSSLIRYGVFKFKNCSVSLYFFKVLYVISGIFLYLLFETVAVYRYDEIDSVPLLGKLFCITSIALAVGTTWYNTGVCMSCKKIAHSSHVLKKPDVCPFCGSKI